MKKLPECFGDYQKGGGSFIAVVKNNGRWCRGCVYSNECYKKTESMKGNER
jgi:hypothetical protein